MVRTLICFDTDGVFDCGAIEGPIDSKLLSKIRYIDPNELKIFVVSESPFYPKNLSGTELFHIQNDKPSRWLNLIECERKCIEVFEWKPRLKIYVSDNGDQNEARKAGFMLVHPDLFSKMFGVNKD